ncbi:MAG TPA: hypothetical protein VK444_03130 [Methanobacteriaceae archaeon]|nr:hypothetical protein [Methanobacteriaceae archaeon]
MHKDPIKEYLKDDDRRAKAYLAFIGLIILSTILIVFGTFMFILRVLKII